MASRSDNRPPAATLLALFDVLDDVMFCHKGLDGRYLAVNPAFVRRSGRRSARDVLGARARDLFPAALAERYEEQDRKVLTTGRPLRDELELIRRPDGRLGWYLTTKLPVPDPGTRAVTGLVSVSRDLETPSEEGIAVESLTRVVELVDARLDEPLRVADLAAAAGCSPAQLERRLRKVFGLTATHYVLRARVDRATTLLTTTDEALATVATRCGFYDQASFTRQFARLTGDTPAQFRLRHRPG
jgi:PAS domain S-box-containing protein